MKLLQITVHFEYADTIEAVLDRHEVEHYVVYPRIEGRDREGRHEGTQVFPGNLAVIQAQVDDANVEQVLSALRTFRDQREAHRHLEALVLPIEQRL